MDSENQPEVFTRIQNIESRILFLEQRVGRILEELGKIREKPNVENVIVEFLEDLEKIKRDWKEEEKKINSIKGFIENFNTKMEEIRKIDIKGFEENVEKLNQALKKLEDQKRMIESVYETIISATKPLNERITLLENEIKNFQFQPKEIDSYKINELDSRVSSLEEDFKKIAMSISTLPSQPVGNELAEKIENIEKKISNLEVSLSNLRPTEIKEGTISTDEIVKNFFSLNERIEKLEMKTKNLESIAKELEKIKSKETRTEITSLLEEINQKISSLEERFEIKKKISPIIIE
ncbi:MAG: hypothetical protein QW412_01775 [Candidatus Aenigmatarchaeota archaeon]